MDFAGKTVLVTGATGFLGNAIARRLATEGARVRALARTPHKADRLRDVPDVEIAIGDITDAARMRAVEAGCELVIHCAAALNGPPEVLRHANVTGTQHVAQAAAEAGVARLVHISSIAVYGFHRHGDITEDMGPAPHDIAYATTKTAAEQIAQETAARTGLPITILRPGMIYGPGSRTWTGLACRLARRPAGFIGRGSGSAPAIYVDDVVDLCLTAATHPAAAGQTFNATPDPSPTWRAYLGGYARLHGHQDWLGIAPGVVKLGALAVALAAPQGSYARHAPLLVDFTQARITYRMTKARERLGWSPQVDLATGIARCAPWLRAQGWLADGPPGDHPAPA